MTVRRIILLVCDGLGVGELPDAAIYGDQGSNTLLHLAEKASGLKVPHLRSLGLDQVISFPGPSVKSPKKGAYGKMAEQSAGKDTTTGHWEMMGLITQFPSPIYPNGFPREIVEPFEKAIGRKILGNKAASGTEIIKELGEEHLRTGLPIVYTSADSVFQIACHEKAIPLPQLYEWCEKARRLLSGKHAVGRVIARPFLGDPGAFKRTENRRDFALLPPAKTFLDLAKQSGRPVTGIGKIEDIFSGQGITQAHHTGNNDSSMQTTINLLHQNQPGIIFTNLVDFDMLYGHRNDPLGYAQALEAFDAQLGVLTGLLKNEDLLLITADHGCDPTDTSTDHTREYVPILAYSPVMRKSIALGTRSTFADLGATCAGALNIPYPLAGKSFCRDLCLPAS